MARKQRRQHSSEFKFRAVLASLRGEKTAAQICRENKLNDNLLSRWKQEFLERAPSIWETDQPAAQAAEQTRIAEPERLVGRYALENDILKKAGAALGLGLSSSGQS